MGSPRGTSFRRFGRFRRLLKRAKKPRREGDSGTLRGRPKRPKRRMGERRDLSILPPADTPSHGLTKSKASAPATSRPSPPAPTARPAPGWSMAGGLCASAAPTLAGHDDDSDAGKVSGKVRHDLEMAIDEMQSA